MKSTLVPTIALAAALVTLQAGVLVRGVAAPLADAVRITALREALRAPGAPGFGETIEIVAPAAVHAS